MAKSEANPKVDFYFNKEDKWHDEIARMRTIALDSGLTEELKWGCPCYSLNGKNVLLIHTFKEYCAYLFFKGALMNDDHRILIQQTKNVQSPRQVRFTNVREITDLQSVLKAYIHEAIELEKAGLKVIHKTTAEFAIPEEFQTKLDHIPALKAAFEALTPGRQRGYLFHFAQPKQSKTREARVEKFIPKILAGKGWDD